MRLEIILVVLAVAVGAEPAAAQGLGWLFGAPPPTFRRAPRASRSHPIAADVPLPVPRPYFPGDGAVPAEIAEGPLPHAVPTNAGSTPTPLPPDRPPQADLQSAPGSRPPPASDTNDGAMAAAKDAVRTPGQTVDVAEPSAPTPDAASKSTARNEPGPPLPPQKPPGLAPAVAAPDAATIAPSGATTAFTPREPALDAGCADRLKARGVVAEATTLPPQPDARCTVVQPMRLVSAKLEDGATVGFPDTPTVACTTADAFSAYVHDLLAPLARGTWGVGLSDVWTGPGLECRSRDHIFGAKLSAHGQGLAIDIAQLKLGDGRLVAVGEPKTDVERDFETAARAGGCGYFHTVLGPGSDSYHRTHWHFDLEVRGRDGDGKYCK